MRLERIRHGYCWLDVGGVVVGTACYAAWPVLVRGRLAHRFLGCWCVWSHLGLPWAGLPVQWTLLWTLANPFAGLLSLLIVSCFVGRPLPLFLLHVTLELTRTSLAVLAIAQWLIGLSRLPSSGQSCDGVFLLIGSSFRLFFRWRGHGRSMGFPSCMLVRATSLLSVQASCVL